MFYISNDNHLKEIAYSAARGWYAGDLNARNYAVAPYSKVAATFLPGNGQVLRVYVQSPDNTIQEYGYDSTNPPPLFRDFSNHQPQTGHLAGKK